MKTTTRTTDRKFLFLVNQKAGHRKGESLLRIVEAWGGRNGIDFEVCESHESGGYPHIEERILDPEKTVIAVIGGDGTFRQVCASLRHTGACFGILPAGSGNGLALGTGIPKDPNAALELLLHGEAQWTDGLSVNGHFSCMLSGIGFDAAVAHEFSRQKTRGLITYAKITLLRFFGSKPYTFHLKNGDTCLTTKAFFISTANSNQFGNRFTIAPKAHVDDGLLDIVVVREMAKWQIPLAVFQQIRGGDIDEDLFRKKGILYFRTGSIEIGNPEMAPLHIDGDPVETDATVRIEVIPKAFKLIRP